MNHSIRFLLMLCLALICALSVVWACGDDDDDDDDDASDDDDAADDDDDDAGDDDDNDDDTPPCYPSNTPVIAGGSWDPNPVELDTFEGWVSYLSFTVHDADDNLDGGMICLFQHGSPTSDQCVSLAQTLVEGIPSAPDCAEPAAVEAEFNFTLMLGLDDDYCVDFEISDGENNWSNRLENVCVFVPAGA